MRRPVGRGQPLATTLADNGFEMGMAAGSETQYRENLSSGDGIIQTKGLSARDFGRARMEAAVIGSEAVSFAKCRSVRLPHAKTRANGPTVIRHIHH